MYYLLSFYIAGFIIYINYNGIYRKADNIVDKFMVNTFSDEIIEERNKYKNKQKGFQDS
jgi:hypothetical protein